MGSGLQFGKPCLRESGFNNSGRVALQALALVCWGLSRRLPTRTSGWSLWVPSWALRGVERHPRPPGVQSACPTGSSCWAVWAPGALGRDRAAWRCASRATALPASHPCLDAGGGGGRPPTSVCGSGWHFRASGCLPRVPGRVETSRAPGLHSGLWPWCSHTGKQQACGVDVFSGWRLGGLASRWFSLVKAICGAENNRCWFWKVPQGWASGVGASASLTEWSRSGAAAPAHGCPPRPGSSTRMRFRSGRRQS